MIATSLLNPPKSDSRCDPQHLRDHLNRLPNALRKEVWWMHPDKPNPPGTLTFPTALTRAQVRAAKLAADEFDCRLWFYIGLLGDLPAPGAELDAALNIFRGVSLCFDAAADKDNQDRVYVPLGAMELGFPIGIEANRRWPWIDDFMRASPRAKRTHIVAQHWLWETSSPDRYIIQQVKECGGIPTVLLSHKTDGRTQTLGFPNLTDAEWEAKKVELCESYIAQGAKVVYRFTNDTTQEQIEEVAMMQEGVPTGG